MEKYLGLQLSDIQSLGVSALPVALEAPGWAVPNPIRSPKGEPAPMSLEAPGMSPPQCH